MVVIRRLYVYLICGVSLIVLSIGLANLLGLALSQVWEALTGSRQIVGTATEVRREVSLYLALVAVSLPIWLVHWYLAERWSDVDRPDSDRGSGVRALFFAAVLTVTVFNFGTGLGTLSNAALTRIFGGETFFSAYEVITGISIVAVMLTVWTFHAWIRERDTRSVSMAGAGVWPVRLYTYAAGFIGGIILLSGIAQLLLLAVDAAVGQSQLTTGETWWASSLASALSLVIVGGVIWGVHWFTSLRLLEVADWRAASEQHSALRRAYLYLTVLAGVAVTLVGLILGLTEGFKALFDVDPGIGADPLWARLISPLMIAVPFGLFWFMHQQVIGDEARRFAERPRQIAIDRLYTYIVAFIALAFTAAGLAYLLGVLIEFAFENARILDTDLQWVPERISQFLSITLIGSAVWVWQWAKVQRRVAEDPFTERTATSRRVYVYLILAASTLATLIALAIILYQGLQILLDVRSTAGIASDIGDLIGIVVIAGALLAYHILILRGDLSHEAVEAGIPTAPPVEPATVARLPLVLSAPTSVDLEATLAELRRHLPRNVELRLDDERAATRSSAEVETPTVETPEPDETAVSSNRPETEVSDDLHGGARIVT